MRLYYFTQSYPFGIGEQWKANELNVLVGQFDKIVVIPYSYAGNFNAPKTLPEGVELRGPLFKEDILLLKKSDVFRILFHPKSAAFLREFFSKKVYREKGALIKWAVSTVWIIKLLRHPVIRSVVLGASKNDVLYFYWGKGSCDFLPFVDAGAFYKTFIRMHRYDLFEDVNKGYIPYREVLLRAASFIAPSSQAGKDHLDGLYPAYRDRVRVVRCGTLSNGRVSAPSSDNVLRVISCSFLSPVKRVEIMIRALALVSVPVEWTHVGDGVLRKELEELAAATGAASRFRFQGMMDSREVLDFYASGQFDLFVNVSSSEGVPFSIMEAFSAGIPVLATEVGGTGEIVDEAVGGLLPADVTAGILKEKLEAFYHRPAEQKLQLRREAVSRYDRCWNAQRLAGELSDLLKQ
ncbi:MAG TPA: glycosyltransferase [Puia sp.]